jgi:hypothetical protein
VVIHAVFLLSSPYFSDDRVRFPSNRSSRVAPTPPLATPSRADRGFFNSPVNYWDAARPLSTLDTLRTDLNVGRGRLQHHLGPKSSFFATALQVSPIPTAVTTPLHHFSKSDPTLQLGSSYSSSLNSPLAFDLYPPATHLFLNTPFICELYPSSATLQFNSLDTSSFSSLTIMGLRAGADSPPNMPSAVPSGATLAPAQAHGVNGSATPNNLSADDNIRRFEAPSRTLSPSSAQALFHSKTRCFV